MDAVREMREPGSVCTGICSCAVCSPQNEGDGHGAQGLAVLRSEEALLRLIDKMARNMWRGQLAFASRAWWRVGGRQLWTS